MGRADSMTGTRTDTAARTEQWRLRYMVGDLAHYTEWTTEFATIENYYEQYQRDKHIQEVTIERRDQLRRAMTDGGEELVIVPGHRTPQRYHRSEDCYYVQQIAAPESAPLSELGQIAPCANCCSEDTGEGETVEVCPECDHPNIQSVDGAGQSLIAYRCRECGTTFDQPATRPETALPSETSAHLAGKLMQADPDDVSGDADEVVDDDVETVDDEPVTKRQRVGGLGRCPNCRKLGKVRDDISTGDIFQCTNENCSVYLYWYDSTDQPATDQRGGADA